MATRMEKVRPESWKLEVEREHELNEKWEANDRLKTMIEQVYQSYWAVGNGDEEDYLPKYLEQMERHERTGVILEAWGQRILQGLLYEESYILSPMRYANLMDPSEWILIDYSETLPLYRHSTNEDHAQTRIQRRFHQTQSELNARRRSEMRGSEKEGIDRTLFPSSADQSSRADEHSDDQNQEISEVTREPHGEQDTECVESSLSIDQDPDLSVPATSTGEITNTFSKGDNVLRVNTVFRSSGTSKQLEEIKKGSVDRVHTLREWRNAYMKAHDTVEENYQKLGLYSQFIDVELPEIKRIKKEDKIDEGAEGRELQKGHQGRETDDILGVPKIVRVKVMMSGPGRTVANGTNLVPLRRSRRLNPDIDALDALTEMGNLSKTFLSESISLFPSSAAMESAEEGKQLSELSLRFTSPKAETAWTTEQRGLPSMNPLNHHIPERTNESSSISSSKAPFIQKEKFPLDTPQEDYFSTSFSQFNADISPISSNIRYPEILKASPGLDRFGYPPSFVQGLIHPYFDDTTDTKPKRSPSLLNKLLINPSFSHKHEEKVTCIRAQTGVTQSDVPIRTENLDYHHVNHHSKLIHSPSFPQADISQCHSFRSDSYQLDYSSDFNPTPLQAIDAHSDTDGVDVVSRSPTDSSEPAESSIHAYTALNEQVPPDSKGIEGTATMDEERQQNLKWAELEGQLCRLKEEIICLFPSSRLVFESSSSSLLQQLAQFSLDYIKDELHASISLTTFSPHPHLPIPISPDFRTETNSVNADVTRFESRTAHDRTMPGEAALYDQLSMLQAYASNCRHIDLPLAARLRTLWANEHSPLLGLDNTSALGTEIADALETIPRSPIYSVPHAVTGIPTFQQQLLWALASPSPAIIAHLVAAGQTPVRIDSSRQTNTAVVSSLEQRYTRSLWPSLLQNFLRTSLFRVYGSYESSDGLTLYPCSATIAMRPPDLDPQAAEALEQQRGLVWFYIMVSSHVNAHRIQSNWEIKHLPFRTPQGEFLLARYLPNTGQPGVVKKPRVPSTPSPPLPLAPASTLQRAQDSSPNAMEGIRGPSSPAHLRSYLTYMVETESDSGSEDGYHFHDYIHSDDDAKRFSKQLLTSMDDDMDSIDFISPLDRQDNRVQRVDLQSTLLEWSNPSSASSSDSQLVTPLLPLEIPGVATLPLDSPFSPPATFFRSCNPITHLATDYAPLPFNAPFDEYETGLVNMYVDQKPDGSWVSGYPIRAWWEDISTANTIDGLEIAKFIDPQPLIRLGSAHSLYHLNDFRLSNIVQDVHPEFRELTLGIPLFEQPQRSMDSSLQVSRGLRDSWTRADQGLQVSSMFVQTDWVRLYEHTCHFLGTVQREEATIGSRVQFKPEEYFVGPSSRNTRHMYDFPPDAISRQLLSAIALPAHRQRQLSSNAIYLDNRPKTFDNFEFSTQTISPAFKVEDGTIFQRALARVGSNYYLDLERAFVYFTCQERALEDNSFMFHRGRMDALAIVMLRLRQAMQSLNYFCTQMGLDFEIERTMMPPGWYYHQCIYVNPLLSEGEVNRLMAIRHILIKFGLFSLLDPIDNFLFSHFPDAALVRLLTMMGFLNWRKPTTGDDPAAVSQLLSVIDFQKRVYELPVEDKLLEALRFLEQHPEVVSQVFRAETYFARKPTATNYRSFKDLFYDSQLTFTIKKPLTTRPVMDTNAMDTTDVSPSTLAVAEPL